jgi:hypothetical protein
MSVDWNKHVNAHVVFFSRLGNNSSTLYLKWENIFDTLQNKKNVIYFKDFVILHSLHLKMKVNIKVMHNM